MKKTEVIPIAQLVALMMGNIGFLFGVIYSFGGLAIDTLVSLGWISPAVASTPGLSYGTILAFGALVGMPLIFAVFGFVIGFVGALVYRIVR